MTTKVVLFTSQDIGHDIVSYLHSRKDIELTVVTQHTQRDEIYGYRNALDLCLEKGIRALSPSALDGALLSEIERIAPDLVISAYYPRIFPRRLTSIPQLGCINVHPGLLPQYRGRFSTPWCILNSEKEIGITIHYLDDGVDTGDILFQRSHPIDPNETGHELYHRSMRLCAEYLIENFEGLLSRNIASRPQPAGGSCYNFIAPQYRIDWHQPRHEIRNQIRVHAKPYFPAFSFLMNKCVTINKASFIDLPDHRAQGAGLICKVFDDMKFVASCVDGCLLIEDYDLFPMLRPDDVTLHIRPGNRF